MIGPIALTWLKLSDGAAAVDMQVALVTQWLKCGVGHKVSVQSSWGAGPTGAFSLQFTNAHNPAYDALATNYPASAMAVAPTQPANAADNNVIMIEAPCLYVRELYTPTSGGSGVLPTTTFASDSE